MTINASPYRHTAPQTPTDRCCTTPGELDLIFCLHEARKRSKNLALQYKNREYPLTEQGKGYRLRGEQVTVCEAFDGTVSLLHKGCPVSYRILGEGAPPIPLDDEKSIHTTVEQARAFNSPEKPISRLLIILGDGLSSSCRRITPERRTNNGTF